MFNARQVFKKNLAAEQALAGLPPINPLFRALNVSNALFAGEREAVC